MRVPENGSNPPPPSTLGQRIIFYATVTDDAVARHSWLDPSWSAAITADPAYGITDTQLAKLGGRQRFAWGSPEQIPLDAIESYAEWIGAAGVILQAETSLEYWHAADRGYTVVVGNPNAWLPEQRQDATDRGLAVICEVYDGRPDTYSSQGIPPASLCFGVALDDRYIPLADYLTLCPIGFRHTFSVWHAAGLTDEDWKLIGGVT